MWLSGDQANVGTVRIRIYHAVDGRPADVKTLDDLVVEMGLDRCDFIKCDAEGADVDIVMGGERTIRKFHPKLAICTYHADDHYRRLRGYLLRLGYQVRGKGFLNACGRLRVVMLHAWWPGGVNG